MALSDSNPSTRERWLGPYRLHEELGRGANGVVYLAEREGRKVALKVLLPTGVDDPEAVVRFQLEADVARKLDDPGVIRVYDAGREGNHYYFAMEYCAGPTLRKRLKLGKPYEVEAACRLLSQLARTVAHAHSMEILHRDIKPANIILDPEQGGRPRITDFGLARDRSLLRSLTETGTIMGTPLYMSPEQLRGEKDVDGRADVYSLGVILFQCLTGEPPHQADNRIELTKLVLYEDAPPPSRLRPDLPPWLDDVCLRALAKDRDARSTAEELLEDLEAGLRLGGRRDSSRRRPPPPRKVRRSAQTSQTIKFSIGLVAIGLAAAGGILFGAGGGGDTGGAAVIPGPTEQVAATPTTPIDATPLSPELEAAFRSIRGQLDDPRAWADAAASGFALTAEQPAARARLEALLLGQAERLHDDPRSGLRRALLDDPLDAALADLTNQASEPLRSTLRYVHADFLRRRGAHRRCEEVTKRLIEDGASDLRPQALLLLAHARLKTRLVDGAWESLRDAYEADPEGPHGLTALAERALACHHLEEALDYSQRALELDAEHALAQVAQARARVDLMRPWRELPADCDEPELLLCAWRDSGRSQADPLQRAMQLTQGRDADALYEVSMALRIQANAARQDEQPEQVQTLLARAAQALQTAAQVRHDARIGLNLGVVLLELQRNAEGLSALREAISKDRHAAMAELERLELGDTEGLRDALGIGEEFMWSQRNPNPPSPRGLARLAGLVEAAPAKARAAVAAALRSASEGLTAWPEVERTLEAAVSMVGDDALTLRVLAEVYLGRDATQAARKLLTRCEQLGAGGPEIDLLRAEALQREGHQAEAIAAYQAVSAGSPDSIPALVAQAEVAWLEERVADTAAAAQRVLERDPQHRAGLALRVLALSESDAGAAQAQAIEATDLFGCLDTRLLYARSGADTSPLLNPEGLDRMFASTAMRGEFRRLTRNAKAAVWLSAGTHTPRVMLKDTLELLLDNELRGHLSFQLQMWLMIYFHMSARSLVTAGLQRDPECGEFYQARWALTWRSDEARQAAQERAVQLGAEQPSDLVRRVGETVAGLAPQMRIMEQMRRGGGPR